MSYGVRRAILAWIESAPVANAVFCRLVVIRAMDLGMEVREDMVGRLRVGTEVRHHRAGMEVHHHRAGMGRLPLGDLALVL